MANCSISNSAQAFVKVVRNGGTRNHVALAKQIKYLSRNGEFDVVRSARYQDTVIPTDRISRFARAWTAQTGIHNQSNQGNRQDLSTHLVVSFPHETNTQSARRAARDWTQRMFHSGLDANGNDVPGMGGGIYDYVTVFHTDRPHPHLHIIVNRRDMANGNWLKISRRHPHMNYDTMREVMVDAARNENIDLEATSRVARGLMDQPITLAQHHHLQRQMEVEFDAAYRDPPPPHGMFGAGAGGPGGGPGGGGSGGPPGGPGPGNGPGHGAGGLGGDGGVGGAGSGAPQMPPTNNQANGLGAGGASAAGLGGGANSNGTQNPKPKGKGKGKGRARPGQSMLESDDDISLNSPQMPESAGDYIYPPTTEPESESDSGPNYSDASDNDYGPGNIHSDGENSVVGSSDDDVRSQDSVSDNSDVNMSDAEIDPGHEADIESDSESEDGMEMDHGADDGAGVDDHHQQDAIDIEQEEQSDDEGGMGTDIDDDVAPEGRETRSRGRKRKADESIELRSGRMVRRPGVEEQKWPPDDPPDQRKRRRQNERDDDDLNEL